VEYAAAKGLAVVVMEPLRGGQLAKEPPAVVAKVWNNTRQRSPVEWALDWVWNQPEIRSTQWYEHHGTCGAECNLCRTVGSEYVKR